jgi:hypothetical protein
MGAQPLQPRLSYLVQHLKPTVEPTHQAEGASGSSFDRYVQQRTAYWEDYAANFRKWEPMRRYYRQRPSSRYQNGSSSPATEKHSWSKGAPFK